MFIAFEGPTGVGKTTIAEALAGELSGQFFPDPFAEVTRFNNVNSDPLATELEFLFRRYTCLESIRERLKRAPDQPAICDWHVRKYSYFARQNLSNSDFEIISRFASLVEAASPNPDLLIFLCTSTTEIKSRITKRGRPYEQHINHSQIDRMSYDFSMIASTMGAEGRATVHVVDNSDGIRSTILRLKEILSGILT